MKMNVSNPGFSMLTFVICTSMVTISLSFVLPLTSQLYKNVVTYIHMTHHDLAREYALEIMRLDIASAPVSLNSWKYDSERISFKDSNKKIAWAYKNTHLYRTEKKYAPQKEESTVEKRILLQHIPKISFQIGQDTKSVQGVTCTITQKENSQSYHFLLRSGTCI